MRAPTPIYLAYLPHVPIEWPVSRQPPLCSRVPTRDRGEKSVQCTQKATVLCLMMHVSWRTDLQRSKPAAPDI